MGLDAVAFGCGKFVTNLNDDLIILHDGFIDGDRLELLPNKLYFRW